MAAFLPESKLLMSISQFVLAAGWLIGGNIINKLKSFVRNKTAVIISLIFLLHLLGLIYTEDFNYALKDLRIKLPLLIFPLIVSTSRTLSQKKFDTLLYLFCGSVLFATIYSTIILKGWTHHIIHDIREISVYMSHIRFGLMIAFAGIILLYLVYKNYKTYKPIITIGIAASIIWFLVFLVILEAITGIIILGIIIILLLIYLIWKKKNMFLRAALLILLIGIPIYCIYFVYDIYKPFTIVRSEEATLLETKTPRGNIYENHPEYKVRENGHPVYLYICWDELKDAWTKRSKINFDSTDVRGQYIRYTLIRFLASKNARKDLDGVNGLTDEEVHSIENGATNVNYQKLSSLKARIYETMWEYDDYIHGGDPNGHSLVQRFEYWKTSFNLIRKNPLIGVGTGDINLAFDKEYALEHSRLDKGHRLKSHNQYLSITVTFGILGLIIFLFALIYPMFVNQNYKDYFFVTFWIFIMISMLTEDTIETQVGVSFFIFFFTLFLFAREKKV
jgi:hypothetical protein